MSIKQRIEYITMQYLLCVCLSIFLYPCRLFVLAVHSAMIEYMDQNIGRVIQYLKDTGQYDNTFIMFTSDNGGSEPFEIALFQYASGFDPTHAKQFVAGINNSLSNLGNPNSDFNYGAWGTYVAVSPLSGFKTSLYEGGVRPPAIIKAPQSALLHNSFR